MVSRRSFLGHGCSLGVAATTLTSSMATLGFARQAAAQQSFSDYKAFNLLKHWCVTEVKIVTTIDTSGHYDPDWWGC